MAHITTDGDSCYLPWPDQGPDIFRVSFVLKWPRRALHLQLLLSEGEDRPGLLQLMAQLILAEMKGCRVSRKSSGKHPVSLGFQD